MATDEKLVRDYVPERITAAGGHAVIRTADLDEYRHLLRQKLVEESMKFGAAGDEANQRQELADVLEVVWTLAKTIGLRPFELDALRAGKHKTHGGFDLRIVLEER